MVTDIHRAILLWWQSPKGSLRLFYEGSPVGDYHRASRGMASIGIFEGKIQRVLDLVQDEMYSKCPIIMGVKCYLQVVYTEYAEAGLPVLTLKI